MQKVTPCLWLKRGADEAAKLYASTFKNSHIGRTTYYGDAASEVSGMPKGAVLTIDMKIAGADVQILHGGPGVFEDTPSLSLFVICGSSDEVDSIYRKLSPGGKTLMELGEYPFSKRYAFFQDKFGVHWQIHLENDGAEQRLMPCIIFGGEKQGLGSEAMKYYLTLFENSKVLVDERYAKSDPGIEGSVMHARILLSGSPMAIMDAGHKAPMAMTGAISFVIRCKDQKEVDYFWNTIAKDGHEIQCGWIMDKFGVQFQIVPDGIEELLYGPDPVKAERATQAMLQMKKLDIEKIRRAYAG